MHRLMLLTALYNIGGTPTPRTPFARAIRDDDLDAVPAFIDHNPALGVATNAAGRSAVWWARFHGCDEVLRLLATPTTTSGQTIVSPGGAVRETLREKPQDDPARTPATGDGSRR